MADESTKAENAGNGKPWWKGKWGVTAALAVLFVVAGLAGAFDETAEEEPPVATGQQEDQGDHEDDAEQPEGDARDGNVSGGSSSTDATSEEPDENPEPEPEARDVTIPEEVVDLTEEFFLEEPQVDEVHVGVDGGEVVISMVVPAATSEDAARELLDNAARFLASQTATYHDDLEGPTSDDLGGLWDRYTLHVMAGPGPDDVIVRGAKVPSSPRLTW